MWGMEVDLSRLTFDEKKHIYYLDGEKKLTGVTSVIDATSAKPQLIQWASNENTAFIKANAVVQEMVPVAQYTKQDVGAPKKTYLVSEELLEEARTAHTRKKDKAASTGTDVHALVEAYINSCISQNAGKPMDVPLERVQPFIDWALENVDVFLAAEQRLYSEKLWLAGTCDFIAIMGGKLTIGDLKTYPKMWGPEAFIQMGAYSRMYTEMSGEKAEQSIVVRMCDPEDERLKKYGGKPFNTYQRFALAADEEEFLRRLKSYRYKENFVSPKD